MLDGPNISSDPRSMYRILGADRKEYGPVSADDIRVWIREGRANGQTLACSEGGAWQPLSSFPEFAQADRKSTRLNSSHLVISYAVFCLKKKKYLHASPRIQRMLYLLLGV